jgi:hypothetical protein
VLIKGARAVAADTADSDRRLVVVLRDGEPSHRKEVAFDC